MAKRLKLIGMRCSRGLTQAQCAAGIDVPKGAYASIELGYTQGSVKNWRKIQSFFGIADADMWGVISDGAEAPDAENPSC